MHCDEACFRACYSEEALATSDSFCKIGHNLLLRIFEPVFLSIPSFVSIKLPDSARMVGTRFNWWQPSHPGANQADWAIDNILIGGSDSLPTTMSDDFGAGQPSSDWLFMDNAAVQSFCETEQGKGAWSIMSNWVMDEERNGLSLVGGIDSKEGTVVTTLDLQLREGTVLEFKVSDTIKSNMNAI